VESYGLMLSGYLMTEHEFKELDKEHRRNGGAGSWGDYWSDAPRESWPFLDLEPIVRKPKDDSDLRRRDLGTQIGAGASLFFKIWKLSTPLKATAMLLGAAGLVALAWYLSRHWDTTLWTPPSFTAGGIVVLVALILGGILFPLLKWLNPQRAMQGYVWKTVVALAGWFFTNLHLWIFDPMFLRRGKLKRLLRLPGD
jgi:hypothetical protein